MIMNDQSKKKKKGKIAEKRPKTIKKCAICIKTCLSGKISRNSSGLGNKWKVVGNGASYAKQTIMGKASDPPNQFKKGGVIRHMDPPLVLSVNSGVIHVFGEDKPPFTGFYHCGKQQC